MRDFISSAPSFSTGTSKINDITLYNKEINTDTYKNICGNCKIDDTENGFHGHLMDIGSLVNKRLDLLLITESWDDLPNSSLSSMESARAHIDQASKKGVQRLLNESLGFLLKKHHNPLEWEFNPRTGMNLAFSTAVKCPSVKGLQSIGVKSLNLCSTYVIEEIKLLKPKHIILFGPLSLKAILKKGWANRHVGKVFTADFDGHECSVGYLPPVEKLARFTRTDTDHAISVLSSFFLKSKDYVEVLKKEHNCNVTLVYGDAPDDSTEVLERFKKADKIAIDIETTGLNFLTEKIRSISMAIDTDVISIDSDNLFGNEAILESVCFLMKSPSIIKAFHNAKFDMKFLNKVGIPVCSPIQDTQVLAHLVNENEPKSLNFLTKKYYRGLI